MSLVVPLLSAPALFLAGIGAGAHCALMCAPMGRIALGSAPDIPRVQAQMLVQGGRVLGYTLLGGIAGGAATMLLAWMPDLRAGMALQVLAAFILIAMGLRQWTRSGSAPRPACCAPAWRSRIAIPPRARLLISGMLWAAMPCGVLWFVLSLAMLSGSFVAGALLLLAFGLGTIPALGVAMRVLQFRASPGSTAARRVAAASLVLAGSLTMIAALGSFGASSAPAWCSAAAARTHARF